jgi:hypothetical protein
VPEEDFLEDEEGGESALSALGFDEESSLFGSGIVGDPFDVDEEEFGL